MPSPRVGVGQGAFMDWARILAYVTGTVDQKLLARNEYLAAENRIIKAQLKGRLKLSDAERGALGEIGHRLGRKALADVATVARPDTILGWYRKLIARKFDGSKARRGPGKPRIKREVAQLIIGMASENRDGGCDWIAGGVGQSGVRDFRSNGWQCFAAPRPAAGAGAQTHDHMGGLRSDPPGAVGGDRLFHRRGADAARAGDLLRGVFHPSREPPGGYRRDHRSPGCAVDEANRPERDHGRLRGAAGLSLF